VGKTTLCSLLAKELTNGYFMDEEHNENPHLPLFYDYMSKGIPGVNPHAFPM
jgi:deoxyadenosine/deoxycytidine kinase